MKSACVEKLKVSSEIENELKNPTHFKDLILICIKDFQLHSINHHQADFIKSEIYILTVFSCILFMLVFCSTPKSEQPLPDQNICSLHGSFSPLVKIHEMHFPLAFFPWKLQSVVDLASSPNCYEQKWNKEVRFHKTSHLRWYLRLRNANQQAGCHGRNTGRSLGIEKFPYHNSFCCLPLLHLLLRKCSELE